MLFSLACGFATHALTGAVHSPNYPKDYAPGAECIWDISVPLGYHIRLAFEHFDIQQSLSCRKDFLQVSSRVSYCVMVAQFRFPKSIKRGQ